MPGFCVPCAPGAPNFGGGGTFGGGGFGGDGTFALADTNGGLTNADPGVDFSRASTHA